jgi:uncharacterized iron-regulated membrane protein
MNRKIHRWTSFPLILFVFAVTITGIYLQWVEIVAATSSSSQAPLERTAPDSGEVSAAVTRAMQAAEEAQPGFPLQKIEISFRGDAPTTILSTNQRIGPSVTVDGLTGDTTYVERPPRNLRTIFILLHSGKFFGMTGLLLIMAASLVLLVLSVTGLLVYIDMYRRRNRVGKSNPFWS